MATSNVNVASQALILLRANTISSFSDDSNEAEIVNTLYTDFIKSLFALHPWSFATKKRLLVQTTTPTTEYSYAHIVPAECVLLWALYDSAAVGALPINDYDIFSSDTSREVHSNYSTLYGEYTRYVDESIWPYEFVQFAVHALAAHLAIPVTHDDNLARYFMKMAYGEMGGVSVNRKGGLYGVAVSSDSKQRKNEALISAPIISARFS